MAILALIMPLISGILTPFVKAWSDYKRTQLTTNEAGFAIGATTDAAVIQAMLTAEVTNNALKVQVYGTPIYRFMTFFVGIPVGAHFALVYIATILDSNFLLGSGAVIVPAAPGMYGSLYEWAIIASFFLVRAAHGGPSNVAQWLGKDQAAK